MKKSASILLSIAVGVATSLAHGANTNRYLVVFKAGTLGSGSAALVSQNGGTVTRSLDQIGVLTAMGDANFAARIAQDSRVLAVGPERMQSNPPATVIPASPESLGAGPTATDDLYQTYQWDMRRIGAPNAWARLRTMSYPRPAVAVLDVGVMDDHPDLVGQVCTTISTSYCSTSGGPNNTPSYPIYSTLIDFDAHPTWTPGVDPCTPVTPGYQAHGTHVSGTIAAKFGGGRVVGVAPDACVGAYKVFDRFRFTDPVEGVVDDVGAFDGPIFSAIIDATLRGYPVISMSLGSIIDRSNKSDNASWLAWNRVVDFANRAGVLIVASAGNDSVNSNGTLAHIPSDLSTVMSTAATGSSNLVFTTGFNAAPGSDVLAFYSDYGSAVDIAAPGGDCGPGYPATCLSQYFILNDYIFESGPNLGRAGYAFFAGTSMATPHVSAVAAYVRALHPTWTPGNVRAYLKSTSQAIGPRQLFGAGMVDADAAAR